MIGIVRKFILYEQRHSLRVTCLFRESLIKPKFIDVRNKSNNDKKRKKLPEVGIIHIFK